MIARQFRRSKFGGMSIVEIMIAILIISVAVIGASGFRYYTMLDARKAAAQMTAARVGLLLCESWRGVSGAATFNPVASFGSELVIEVAGQGPEVPVGFNELGRYKIIFNNLCCWATLSWKDVATGLRALNIVVTWEQRNSGTEDFGQANKTFKLTVYTET